MMLLTKALERRLPPLYATDSLGDEAMAIVKFFSPTSGWTWYATEYDPKERMFFGLVQGFEVELGYFSLAELESVRLPLGLGIERDRGWRPRPLAEVRAALDKGGWC